MTDAFTDALPELLAALGVAILSAMAYIGQRIRTNVDRETDHNSGTTIKGYLKQMVGLQGATNMKLDEMTKELSELRGVTDMHEANRQRMEQALLEHQREHAER